MDSKKGRSKMQMDTGATTTSKDTAAGKRRSKKKVPVMAKKAAKPSVRKIDSTAKETRRRAPVYKLTIPVGDENRDEFNELWMGIWGDLIVSMDRKTTIPSVGFTDLVSPRASICTVDTVQLFEVRIPTKEASGLVWPLHVYGFIATRDSVDYKRNIIFERGKDNCQIVSEGVPYLALTGPARAAVLVDPVYFEVDLKVSGAGQSEDQELIYVASPFRNTQPPDSSLFTSVYTNKISALDLTFGHIVGSVEASVSMKVVHGPWPDGFRGSFAARTASINDMTVWLLEIGDDNGLPLADDGTIKLQRHVVCAELQKREYLEVSVSAYGVGGQRFDDGLHFTPQERGKLEGTVNVDSCEIEVTVTWSLIKFC
ncbi:uncharacterized protein [Triticum aestivum]|uniref:uncharacterized protein n=1 Tax=Triticum aestivum TaxID=4565 RepID=UPI001D028EF7|nr:uncharacterized protein LOC123130841 [Triticum aestivum]